MHVGDVEVNFRPRNYKMSESVFGDGWGGDSGDTMGLRRPLLTIFPCHMLKSSHEETPVAEVFPSLETQNMNDEILSV